MSNSVLTKKSVGNVPRDTVSRALLAWTNVFHPFFQIFHDMEKRAFSEQTSDMGQMRQMGDGWRIKNKRGKHLRNDKA